MKKNISLIWTKTWRYLNPAKAGWSSCFCSFLKVALSPSSWRWWFWAPKFYWWWIWPWDGGRKPQRLSRGWLYPDKTAGLPVWNRRWTEVTWHSREQRTLLAEDRELTAARRQSWRGQWTEHLKYSRHHWCRCWHSSKTPNQADSQRAKMEHENENADPHLTILVFILLHLVWVFDMMSYLYYICHILLIYIVFIINNDTDLTCKC